MTCNTPQLAFNRNAGQCQCESALDSSDYYVIDAYKSVTLLQNSKGAKEGDVWTVWVARSSFSPLFS